MSPTAGRFVDDAEKALFPLQISDVPRAPLQSFRSAGYKVGPRRLADDFPVDDELKANAGNSATADQEIDIISGNLEFGRSHLSGCFVPAIE